MSDLQLSAKSRLRSWRRNKKIVLVESANPRWKDLALDWYGECCKLILDSSLRSE